MEDRESVKELYIKLCDASINKDKDTLNEILADDYILIHMTGKRQLKQDYINSVLSGELKYYETVHESIEVNINGLSIRGAEARKENSRNTVNNWLKDLGY